MGLNIMRKLNPVEYKRWCQYRKQGCSRLSRCKVNPVGLGGGLRHEMAKMRKYFELRMEGHNVILEAVPCGNTSFRHDLVDLTDGIIFEIVDSSVSPNLKSLIDERKVEIIEVDKDE